MLASFGSGAARKKEEWQSLVRQLVAGGLLAPDEHGGLAITEKGMRLRRGESQFLFRAFAPRTKARADAVEPGQTGDPGLLAALKAVRLRLARERQVPAYVIFSDRSLIDMTTRRPRDLDGFSAVNGVGAAKLKDFGAIFLRAIAAHEEAHPE
jgi:ATP-dependent DNA helicase RecQ